MRHTWSYALAETEWPGLGRCIRCVAHLEPCAGQAPSHLSGLDLGRAQNTQPIWVYALATTQEPERFRPGKYIKSRAHLGQSPFRAPWSLSSVDPGNSCCLGLWQAQCGPSTVSTLHTCQRNVFVVTISLHSTTEQVSLNE